VTRGGWGKVACWGTKAAISVKRVTMEEKLPRRAYRMVPDGTGTIPDPLRPKIFELSHIISQERKSYKLQIL